ncbi:MAG: amidinotransferase [Bacteroidia bacterium]|nr:amidinotransferase [Bacteroidia bacterium]MCZ2276889.1 amidinotransferase [Bacteroidia bacterium]
MSHQCTDTVLMVKPSRFSFNSETAESNIFQTQSNDAVSEIAKSEFENAVCSLRKQGIRVITAEDSACPLPDSVFPNNWFSTHPDGNVLIYPLLSQIRRKEKQKQILEDQVTSAGFKINTITDLSHFERKNQFLEGTGSMVMDHSNRIIYACRSSRTHEQPLKFVSEILGYSYLLFDATLNGHEIYHTNVILAIGEQHALLCSEVIDHTDRNMVISLLTSTHDVVEISKFQLMQMAGNMLMLKTPSADFTVMSETAFRSLTQEQLKKINSYSEVLSIPVPCIEQIGGGSIRCMMAEIFLPACS